MVRVVKQEALQGHLRRASIRCGAVGDVAEVCVAAGIVTHLDHGRQRGHGRRDRRFFGAGVCRSTSNQDNRAACTQAHGTFLRQSHMLVDKLGGFVRRLGDRVTRRGRVLFQFAVERFAVESQTQGRAGLVAALDFENALDVFAL